MLTDDRAPPHSLDAERAVLGSILVDPGVLEKVGHLRPDDFHHETHRRLFTQMVKLWDGGRGALDVTLLRSAMNSNGGWSGQDAALVVELWKLCPTASKAEHYAAEIRRLADCRQQIHVGLDLVQRARRGESGGAQAIEELSSIDGLATGIDYGAITAAELDQQEHNIEFLIPGVMAAGQHMLIGGPQKSLKSLIGAADLGVSLAFGGYLLGHFKVRRAVRTAIFSAECGWPVLQENLRRVSRAAGRELRDASGLMVAIKLPLFGSAEHANATRRFLRDNEIGVGIIDCAYQAFPMNRGDVAANMFLMGDMIRTLADVFVEENATMVLLHHTTKAAGTDGEPLQLENLAFAGFNQFAAQWVLLSRRIRYQPGTGHHELWMTTGGRAGHSGLWAVDVDEGIYSEDTPRRWDVAVNSPDEMRSATKNKRVEAKEAAQQAGLAEDVRRLVDALRQFPAGETENILRTRAGLSGTRFTAAMATLLVDKQATEVQLTKPNRKLPYQGYSLTKESMTTHE